MARRMQQLFVRFHPRFDRFGKDRGEAGEGRWNRGCRRPAGRRSSDWDGPSSMAPSLRRACLLPAPTARAPHAQAPPSEARPTRGRDPGMPSAEELAESVAALTSLPRRAVPVGSRPSDRPTVPSSPRPVVVPSPVPCPVPAAPALPGARTGPRGKHERPASVRERATAGRTFCHALPGTSHTAHTASTHRDRHARHAPLGASRPCRAAAPSTSISR
jgi:hypothetical protein